MTANCVKRVALIEDNAVERRILRALIEDMGYEVVAEGSDFDAAIKACRETRPDIAVMDVGLPGQGWHRGRRRDKPRLSHGDSSCNGR